MPRKRNFRSLGAVAALSLTLGTTTIVAAPGVARSAAPPGPVTWGPCAGAPEDAPARVVCATLSVPVDWARPGGPRFDLALAKLPAADPGRRTGSLMVNPGGPGGSGVAMVYGAEDSFSPALTDTFDIVSFDPRGQAASRPVLCDIDAVLAQDDLLYPRNATDYAALRDATGALGASCRELTGPLAGHVDTDSVVRDMDAVRAAIGEQTISYYGVSYGTMIGQQYAELFPKRIRAMVLDSNMDHAQDIWSYQKWEALAMEGSFQQFAAWCARTATCALHDRDLPEHFDGLYARAEAGDLVLEPGTEFEWVLRPRDLLSLVFGFMYNPADWFALADLLRELGDAAPATARLRRGEPVELGYRPVMCQDFHFDLRSYRPVAAMERALRKLAPRTRLNPLAWTDLTGCQNWPGRVTNPPHRLKASPHLPPILLTNSRYDVATPYEWGRSLASQLPSATFLTYDGVGHGNYRLSPCARAAIDTYLLTGRTPARGTHCPAVFPAAEQHRRATAGPPIRPLTR